MQLPRRGGRIRTVIWFVLFALSLVITLPWLLVSRLRKGMSKWTYAHRKAKWWARFLLWVAGARIEVIGREHLVDETTLFVGNHSGNFDIPICITQLPGPAGFVSKIENARLPLVHAWMHEIGCIFIDHADMRQQVRSFGEAGKRIEQGLSYIIFPEGTRSLDGAIGEFKPGAFKLATKNEIAIQPFAIVGSPDLMRKGSPWIRPARIRLVFGERIPYEEGMNRETVALSERVKKEVERLYEQYRFQSHSA